MIIERNVVFTNSVFEGNNVIKYGSSVVNSYVGKFTYMGQGCKFNYVKIGRFCSIGSDVKVVLGSHPTEKFVSTHPVFFSTLNQVGKTFVKENLYEELKYVDYKEKIISEIGNDVWIGQSVMIMQGVKIGDGAVIGAGAIVTKDVEPYSINVGVPSKSIGYRFESKYIQKLLNFKWWDKDVEWIEKNASKFNDIKVFLNNLG